MLKRTKQFRVAFVVVLVMALAFAGLLAIAPATRADHNTIPWVSYGDVSSNTEFDRNIPLMLAGPGGSFYEFYLTTSTATSASNINVSMFTPGGFVGFPTLNFDVQVNDAGNQNLVSNNAPLSAAMDHSGNLYLAWTRVPFGGANEEIYVSKSTDGGESWQTAVPVRTASAIYQDFWPSLGVAADGTLRVAWVQEYGGFVNITVATSTNGGSSFTGVTNASGQGARGYAEFPSLTVDSHGRIYLAYMGLSPGYFSTNVTWSDDGTTWSSPVQLTPQSTIAELPQILADGSGRVHLVWWDLRGISAVGVPQIYYTRSLDRGATWSPALPITSNLLSPSGFTSIAAHGDTLMVGTWGGGRLGYVISADGGATWYPEERFEAGFSIAWASLAANQNDTFFAGVTDASGSTNAVALLGWNGPPSTPGGVSVAVSGLNSLTVSWAAPPEPNVVEYQLWRSVDGGATYQLAATLPAGTTSYTDGSLANGTYWYKVDAVNVLGTPSHDSTPVSGTVGPTLEQLQAELANLQNELNTVNGNLATTNANLASIQAQLTALKNQVSSLQGNTSALQNQINQLQNQLNTLQGQQATQTMSYANLAFEIIVVVLLVVVLLNQTRKPKRPQIMMAQPGQAAPSKPEDEL